MKYLGIVSLGHDASVSLVDSSTGDILFAGHAERYSHIKNDGMINDALLDDCLSYGKPDAIVWYEKPLLKLTRQLFSGQFECINVESPTEHLAHFGLELLPRHTVKHHHSHAAGGYFTSKFDDASILVCDAIGEWQTISIWEAHGEEMKCVWSQRYPDSLGLLYSAVTQRCGLKPNEEEYILMGMAALGNADRFYQDLKSEFIVPQKMPKFKLTQNVHRGIGSWGNIETDQDKYDLAAAMQKITEEYLCDVAIWMRQKLKSRNLILSGGVALNCCANSKIAQLNIFDNIWIMPNPGDAGSSLGAIAAHMSDRLNWNGPYLGHNIDRTLDIESVVLSLQLGDVVGIANGRAEFGPRALGNRSLIADPRGHAMKDKVNNIKHRELFRPFAPVILEEFAWEYFDMPVKQTPYMQFVAKVRRPELYPAITHYDGTARVQTLSKDQNPVFHALLTRWFEKTGCPMLLNTSLNIKGYPLVNTWQDALKFQSQYGVEVF